jgi:hypothetical protein
MSRYREAMLKGQDVVLLLRADITSQARAENVVLPRLRAIVGD